MPAKTREEAAMSCSTHTLPAETHPGHGIAETLKRWWTSYWEHRAQRTTVLMLQGLDDQTLRDLGLGRSEIESVVYDGTDERTRHYRRDWA
jgi:uncharacterized protein YjiS (DUF1127 family)